MPATAEALLHQILDPSVPSTAATSPPAPASVRETASVLIGRILNPAEHPSEPPRDADG